MKMDTNTMGTLACLGVGTIIIVMTYVGLKVIDNRPNPTKEFYDKHYKEFVDN